MTEVKLGKKALGLLAGIGFVGLISSVSASATIVDFEAAATGSCTAFGPASTAGFTVTDGDFNNNTACSVIAATAHSGTQYMLNHQSFDGEFTKDSGTFTLESFWVHSDLRVGSSTVRFEGLDGIGGTVLNTIDVVIGAFWQEINLTGWNNITTFTWNSIVPGTGNNIAIDDFTYTATGSQRVPEPGILGLLGLGLMGLGVVRRKRLLK